jgi:hypothetical protein
MLAESTDGDFFTRFVLVADFTRQPARTDNLGAWRFLKTQEPCSLVVTDGDSRLILIASHQVAAAEDLEVLMLGTAQKVADGLPIRDLLEEAHSLGALRVILWGPGKWLFSR